MAEFHRCDRCLTECSGGSLFREVVSVPRWLAESDRPFEMVAVQGHINVSGWEDAPDLCDVCKIEIVQAVHAAMLAQARQRLAPEYREFNNALTNAPTTSLAPDPRD